MARHIQQAFGVPCVEVKAYFQLYGGFNGGTMASMLNMLDADTPVQLDDPFLIDPVDVARPATNRAEPRSDHTAS